MTSFSELLTPIKADSYIFGEHEGHMLEPLQFVGSSFDYWCYDCEVKTSITREQAIEAFTPKQGVS